MIYRLLFFFVFSIFYFNGLCKVNSNDTIISNSTSISIQTDELQKIGDTLLKIPTAFSPYTLKEMNGLFRPVAVKSDFGNIGDFEMYIYNRRGTLVCHTKDINTGWDGTYKGKVCPIGGYVYVIRYAVYYSSLLTEEFTVTTHEKKGSVLLLE